MRKAAAGADSTNSGLQPAAGEPASEGEAGQGGMVAEPDAPPAGTGGADIPEGDPADMMPRASGLAAGNPDNR